MSARSKVNGVVSLTPHPIPDLNKSKVLALDLGRRTGYCLGENGVVTTSGVHELYSERNKDFVDSERFLAFYQFLLSNMDIEAVVFEAVAGGTAGRQTVLFNGYRATLLLWAQMLGKPVIPMAVGTIKKHTAGKGNATKEEMMEAVRRKGIPVFDDNEADAIGAFWSACAIDSSPKPVQDAVKVKRERKTARNGKSTKDSGPRRRSKVGQVDGGGDAGKKRVRKAAVRSAAQKDASSGVRADGRGTKRPAKRKAKPSAPRKNAKTRNADPGN